MLRSCCDLHWLDVTGCYHVGNSALMTAIDVLQQQRRQGQGEDQMGVGKREGVCGQGGDERRGQGLVGDRELTVCIGGTAISDVSEMTLPNTLHVIDTSSPYDHWQLTNGTSHILSPPHTVSCIHTVC